LFPVQDTSAQTQFTHPSNPCPDMIHRHDLKWGSDWPDMTQTTPHQNLSAVLSQV